ncbi:hypothetical protein GCM10027275_40800 [Rhabdobacter roseus]|uniref:Lipid A deacylase LpxR family protein n=1 Tax=Rhabdobacter roseus TaxID=1655419 RepID=A0A840TRX0_9BACT|nr:lipid A deacylase LpxR family protein [Rhabdobacter roseus]MBB5286054.1 hypothetical protein [Rhabdobacter roseus]
MKNLPPGTLRRWAKYLLVLSVWPGSALGQRIDNLAAFRDPGTDRYLRLHYDNDYFTASDYYYTQGYQLEAVHPVLKKNPLTKVLVRLPGSATRYGLALEHIGFTPTHIDRPEVLRGDRPFAAAIFIKSFTVSTDTVQRVRVSAGLSTGVLGPVAFGEGMQSTLHRWLGGAEPLGWKHQIRNDLVLNYELNYERELYSLARFLTLHSLLQLRAGTLSTRAQAGFTMMLGKFNGPFGNASVMQKKPFQLYIYGQPLVSLVGHDATLQGGLFNRKSTYILSAADLTRSTLQYNLGGVFQYKKLLLEYYLTLLSREFETGRNHRWGGVRLGLAM